MFFLFYVDYFFILCYIYYMRTDIISLTKNEQITEIDNLVKAIYFSGKDMKHMYFRGEYTAAMLGYCLKHLSDYEVGDVIKLNSTNYIVLGYYSGYAMLLKEDDYNKPVDTVYYVLKEVREKVVKTLDIDVYLVKQKLLKVTPWIDKMETKEQSDKHIDVLVAELEEHSYYLSKTGNQLKVCISLLTLLLFVPILVILGICMLFHLHIFGMLSSMFCSVFSISLCLFRGKFYKLLDKAYDRHMQNVEKRYFVKKKKHGY